MYRPEVQAKIRARRSPLSGAHRRKISRALEGKYPANYRTAFLAQNNYRSKAAWLEIGGKRYYMKSIWERNVARYLEWLKNQNAIKDWAYEPRLFLFEKIQHGTRAYRPDFRVDEPNGAHHWIEVKGWMDKKSETKLRRMARYYPNERLVLIDAGEYRALSQQLRTLVPGWEIDRNVARSWSPRRYGLVV